MSDRAEAIAEPNPRQVTLLRLAAHLDAAIEACLHAEGTFIGEPIEESLKRCRLVLSRAAGHVWNRGRAEP